MKYTEINSQTIDRWVEEGWEWGIPISHEAYLEAKNGNWSMLLTPTKPVPKEWYPDLKGKKVLGLAAGGGQQTHFCCTRRQNVPSWITPASK